jgi:predicted Zn finger-like uncharacterized protein
MALPGKDHAAMIIECRNCSRKFNLNEGLLRPTGSKVRCTKCGTIFLAVPPDAGRGSSEPDSGGAIRQAALPSGGPESQTGKKKHQRIALSVPVSCIAIDGDGNPLNFYIGLITEVGPADLSIDVFCSTIPDSVLVSFINLDNRDVQIKANVVRYETNPSRKTKIELSLAGTHQEIGDFIAQLVKSYHYAN